jgi:hypothetical protein
MAGAGFKTANRTNAGLKRLPSAPFFMVAKNKSINIIFIEIDLGNID